MSIMSVCVMIEGYVYGAADFANDMNIALE